MEKIVTNWIIVEQNIFHCSLAEKELYEMDQAELLIQFSIHMICFNIYRHTERLFLITFLELIIMYA